MCSKALPLDSFLKRHTITPTLRSKMVDWMIEVLSSYKMSEESFFRSTMLMDLFLKTSPMIQEVNDLHLIGVSSMFTACKYEEIHPFRLSLVYEKIARKKFTKNDILKKEAEIINTLNFSL